ncbi:MAG: hypothetical protein ABFD91_15360 [Anaerohalosphaeraceae bacterium]
MAKIEMSICKAGIIKAAKIENKQMQKFLDVSMVVLLRCLSKFHANEPIPAVTKQPNKAGQSTRYSVSI